MNRILIGAIRNCEIRGASKLTIERRPIGCGDDILQATGCGKLMKIITLKQEISLGPFQGAPSIAVESECIVVGNDAVISPGIRV